MNAPLALIAHDLKNALGALESQLEGMIDEPTPVAAQRAHMQCAELRRQFVQFLTLYSAELRHADTVLRQALKGRGGV